jgi:hypothetical protein
MDANKLEVLRALPYRVQKVCGLCRHGGFVPNTDWGTCIRTQYEHKKHTGPARQLSITRFGSCEGFEPDERRVATLGAYQEFLGP